MNNFRSVILAIAFSLAGVLSASADNNDTPTNNTPTDNTNTTATYYIDAPRFVRPLIEKWIVEYEKVQPTVHFAIAKTAANRETSALHVALSDHNAADELKTVYFAQYAILPVTSKNGDAAKIIGQDELSQKKLKNLFFQGDEWDEQDKRNKKYDGLVVYSGSSNLSVSQGFASHYGTDASAFRGKRIVGDDQYLNNAIAKDPKGITINAIANIYDLQTRQLRTNLTVLPLSVDKSVRSALTEQGTLDQLINSLEASPSKEIPVEAVGLSYQDNETVNAFIAWVLSEGTSYNHAFGFLNLNKDFAQR